MKSKIMIGLLVYLTFIISNVYAHDDLIIHPEITKIAVESSTLDDYLKKNLNLINGVETKLPSDGGKFIMNWLTDGSTAEDHPMCRASNHFHDPLKSWDVSARSDNSWLIWLIEIRGHLTSFKNFGDI